MGVATRSRRCYEGDEVVHLKTRPMKKKPQWKVKAGVIQSVIFARPANETEMFMTLDTTSEEMPLLQQCKKDKAPVQVTAWDPVAKCAYNRGQFTVVRVCAHAVMLQKLMSSTPRQTKSPVVVTCSVPEPEPEPALPAPMTWTTRVFPRPVLAAATTGVKYSSMLRAIPTTLAGVQYRSRLEAKFARLLQLLNIRFVYEPMRHVRSGGGTYTIDFFLPEQQLYVELKPKRPHVEEEQRCEDMSAQGFRVALMYGSSVYKPPFRSELFRGRSHRDYTHHDALRGMCWVDGRKLVGDTVFVVGTSPHAQVTGLEVARTDQAHLNQVVSTRDVRWSHPTVLDALQALRDEGTSLFA